MAISTGGIIEEWGAPKAALRTVMHEVGQFRPRQGDDDYVVDIAFRSWDPRKEPEFTGVQPAMVGPSSAGSSSGIRSRSVWIPLIR